MLWNCFKKTEGRVPPRKDILALAEGLQLEEQKIYKWFWDTQKKVRNEEKIARNLGQDVKLVMDESGSQTVKNWLNDHECQGYEGC